jgi:hypothetical protein
MDLLDNIYGLYGGFIGAEVTMAVKHGRVSVLQGKITKNMLADIQMTCAIHRVESGCIFVIKRSSGYTIKTRGDATKVEQPLMNVLNLV